MPEISLEEVKSALNKWRLTKKTRSEAIPQRIWDQVKILKRHHTKCQIISTLGIGYTQYREKVEQNSGEPSKNTEPQLVSIPMNGNILAKQNIPQQPPQIIMTRPDGLTLSISDFSNEHLSSLISVFKHS